MANGLYAGRKILKSYKKFKKVKVARYSTKAAGAPVFKAIAIGKTIFGAKQPSSANRKCAKIQILKTGINSVAYLPGDHAKDYIQDNDILHICGIGGSKGRTRGDLPVAVFKVIKVNGVSLNELVKGKQFRKNI
jgi:small subunit ribosomal protein S12